VPVTVTVTVPTLLNVQDKVELPDPPVTVVGARVQALLPEARVTSPVNPFRGETLIVEVPGEPTTTVTAEGLAVREKSARRVTVKLTEAEWDSDPLVPVTVTATEPAEPNVHDRTDVPEPPVTVAGVSVQATLSEVKVTSPVNPFKGAILIIEVPGEPTDVVTAVGLAEIVKSGRPVTV